MVVELESELVSVIIPLYNKEEYVERALNSLSVQTYRNIEVIIVDDGSTDNSGQICKNFCEKDTRFKYFYQSNKGVSTARNIGIDTITCKLLYPFSLGDFI